MGTIITRGRFPDDPLRLDAFQTVRNIHWRKSNQPPVKKTYVAYVIETTRSKSGTVTDPLGIIRPFGAPLVDAATGGPGGYVARFGVFTNPIFTRPLDVFGTYAGATPPIGVFDAFEGVMVWTDGSVEFGPGGFVGGYYWSGVEVGHPGTGTSQALDAVNSILSNPANAGLGVTVLQTTVTF